MELALDLETLNSLWICMTVAISASSIAVTITQTEVFAPVRAWSHKLGKMIAHLFQCFYCMSHWVVAAGVLIYQPRLIRSSLLPVDLLVSAFFTITMAAFTSGLLFKVFLCAMTMKLKEKKVKEMLARQ